MAETGGPKLRGVLRSLPGQISVLVFLASLVACLLVTFVSTHALWASLRDAGLVGAGELLGGASRRMLLANLAVAAATSLVAFAVAGWRVRPLERFARDAGVVVERQREEIEAANARLRGQNDELQRVNEVLGQLSITDGLTKLHNHRYFQDQLPREVKRSQRTGAPLALVLFDIDDFKRLNDSLGHAAGDAVLAHVADVMHRSIRDSDLLARYGGEEFALLAPQTDLTGARRLAEKLRRDVVEHPPSVVGPHGAVRVTVSVGVAQLRNGARQLFDDADRALYRAKQSGKDCVCVADPDAAGEP
jgi:diguanylate cyclase (GGDEF)-like protein